MRLGIQRCEAKSRFVAGGWVDDANGFEGSGLWMMEEGFRMLKEACMDF